MKRNDGFTMVELLITIVAAAVVTIGVTSLLLLGTRMQRGATEDASEQQNVRIVMTLLEDMAGSGEIRKVSNTFSGWTLEGDSGVLFEYVAADQALYSGEKNQDSVPLLSGLNGAGAEKGEKGLLHFSFDTVRGGSYKTSVYSRIAVDEDLISEETVRGELPSSEEIADKLLGEDSQRNAAAIARLDFLNALAGEYGNGQNYGKIRNSIAGDAYEYYSEWYIDGFKNGWNADTPWCACFASWASVKSGVIQRPSPFVFADVDAGVAAFKREGTWKWASQGYPSPGDHIFFDWSGDRKDAAHVGVVLNVTDDSIYTIEGNSGGRVAVRQYSKDADVIMGYGSLPFGQANAS